MKLHFEYCNYLLIDLGITLNMKLEDASHDGLWKYMGNTTIIMSGQEHCIVFNIEKIILWYLICIVFEGKKLSYIILS